jgi:N4-gp56 family major capsid protein
MPPPVYGAVTTTDKASEYRLYFSKSLLDHQIDTLQLYDLAYQVEIPTGQGSKTIRMFRPPVANVANVITLSEGQPPSNAPYKLIFEYITRTLQQYGGYAQVSDIIDETEFLNTGDALMTKFGEEAALWADGLIRDSCINGTTEEPTAFTKYYAGAATTYAALNAQAAAASVLGSKELTNVVTKLRKQRCPTFGDGTYAAVLAPEQEKDILDEGSNGWVYASAYQKPEQIWKGEVGTFMGVRVMRTTNACYQNGAGTEGVFVAGGNIIAALVFGRDAFACPKLSGESPAAPKVNTITQPDSANPFGQFITYVWKTFFNGVCCNLNFGVTVQTQTQYTGV